MPPNPRTVASSTSTFLSPTHRGYFWRLPGRTLRCGGRHLRGFPNTALYKGVAVAVVRLSTE